MNRYRKNTLKAAGEYIQHGKGWTGGGREFRYGQVSLGSVLKALEGFAG